LANEWNELSQGNKMVSTFTTFVWFLFFWLGLGWQNYALSDPDWTIKDDNLSVVNPLLKYSMVATLFIFIFVI